MMAHAFQRLLLATEHGEFDTGAEAVALAMARHCQLPLACVMPLVSNPEFEAAAPREAAQAEAVMSALRTDLQAHAAAAGVVLNIKVRRGPEAHVEILDEARGREAELLIIRRRGKRGFLANLLVGEMVTKVVSHAPCSVLIAPQGAQIWRTRVLVGLDPQAPDLAVLACAANVAQECHLPLYVVCVAESAVALAQAQAALASVLSHPLAAAVNAQGEVRVGRAHQALLDAAQQQAADLLVLGRHRNERRARAWLGSTAQKVMGLAPCAVWVYADAQAT
jgi:nucleotide-binding universal stress UspA family protein